MPEKIHQLDTVSSAAGAPHGTRARILDAVLDALIAGEPDPLVIGAVARRAGVSRQAVYLHFDGRAALAVEAARWLDQREDVSRFSAPIAAANTAETLIDAWAAFLAAYNPRIAPVVTMAYRWRPRAPEVEAAWQDRLKARRTAAGRMAERLHAWGRLAAPFTMETAGDWLAAMSSVLLWEELTRDLGWTTAQYEQHLRRHAHATVLTPG
jgi:AcrR family transcriptional regulator